MCNARVFKSHPDERVPQHCSTTGKQYDVSFPEKAPNASCIFCAARCGSLSNDDSIAGPAHPCVQPPPSPQPQCGAHGDPRRSSHCPLRRPPISFRRRRARSLNPRLDRHTVGALTKPNPTYNAFEQKTNHRLRRFNFLPHHPLHLKGTASSKTCPFLCCTQHPRLSHPPTPLSNCRPLPVPAYLSNSTDPTRFNNNTPRKSVKMSAWDTAEVKIGKNANRGAGARETVVRSQSALNAAKRSGAAITTEKKFATGNAVRPITHQPSAPRSSARN